MGSQGVVRMLFTGLVRLGEDLNPRLELAESYQVSADFKTYVFTLKTSYWSDGSPITAYDFEQTWKAALTPAYSSPCTNLFFHLKNGRKASLGEISLEELGVKALNDKTLMIELELPNPHFLNVLINSIFSPVHESMRKTPPNACNLITSGPFRLKKYVFQDQIVLEKNTYYWNTKNLKLDELHYYIVKDPSTALLMFEKQEIDWLGDPLSKIAYDSIDSLRKRGLLHCDPSAGLQWMFLNTEKPPLNNTLIRKALAFAINRTQIMSEIMHIEGLTPSLSLIPKIIKKEKWHPWFVDNDIEQAKKLFAQGLQNLNLTLDTFPKLTITYASTASDKILQAIQQMWKRHLGIDVVLERVDSPILYNKWYDQEYEITWLGWLLQYNDPINMLEIFKYKHTQPNYSGWENAEFVRHATASLALAQEKDRWEHVEAAEKIFFDEMPSIPVSDYFVMHVAQPYVKGVWVNHLYQIDFDRAWIENE
jgi:oligopeptide transport system substrate-binding protein